jgi:hypothetical protein
MHKRVSSGTTILIVLLTLFLALEPVLAGPKSLSNNEPSRPSHLPAHPRPQTQGEQPRLQFSAGTYEVGEHQREAIITVELNPSSDGEVRVTYATYGKTVYDNTVYGQPMAMPGVDYEDTVGRLVFASGETSKTFRVPIRSDAEIEPDEIVYLELSKVVGNARLVGPSAFLTITDPAYNPSGVLQFSDVQYFVNEYHSSTPAPLTEQRTSTAVITVERTVGLSGTVSVDYATREQTAKADLDYDDVAGTLTFASGEATRTFTITVHDDLPTENDETLRLFLANPTGGATLGERDAAELTIVDVPAVHFDRSNYRFDEEAGEVEVLVNLTAPVREGEEIVVSCAEPEEPSPATAASASSNNPIPLTLPLGALPAEGGTTATVPDAGYANEDATPGSDYTFSTQELRFLPGEQQKRVSLTINDNNDIEDDERFSLVLSIDKGRARLGTPSRTQITIQDNDGVSGGTLQFDRSSYEVAEGNAILIIAERTGILSGTVSVRYTTSDGTARAGEDYTEQSGVLVFSPGVSRATFGIATHYDGQNEGNETVHIRLSSPTGGATIAQADTLLTIQDESEAPPRALTVSSPFALPGQEVLFLAKGGSSVEVSVGGQDEQLTLYDDGTHGDAMAGDGLATTSWSVPGAGTVTATLYDNSGQETAQTTVEIISDPALLVLTDWRELYAEFQETGMAINEDQDTDDLHDFYELVERIRQYADNHRGIVVDLPSAITPKQGFLYAYSALPYEGGVGDRYLKGLLVDQLINKLDTRAAHSFRNVAIVGDDQVVPFYRVFDPSNYFEQYYPGDSSPLRRGRNYIADIGGTRGNPVLEDLNQGYLLSDLPYSIRSLQYISEAAWYPQFSASKALPQPDMGIGRVLSRRPLELVRAIDRYEEPLELRPDQARAALFVGDTSGNIKLQDIADRSQKPLLESWFKDHAERLDIPVQSAWSAEDFRQALIERNLVSFIGGSAHYAYTISNTPSVRGYAPDLPAQTLEHPVLLVALGPCFGLSLSNAPDGAGLTRAYTETLVNALASVGATVLAPSSIAYLYPEAFPSPNLHELTTLLFIERLLNAPVSTTGEAWQELYAEFHRTDPALVETPFLSTQLFHIVAGYGMVLYGLPTQPVVRADEAATIEVTTTEQGAHNYQVTATVYDADNQPIAGTFVHFATNKGKIAPTWSRTDEQGQATTTISNGELLVGEFIITATADTIETQTTLNVSVASCTDGENNDTPGRAHDLPLNAVCQGVFASTEEGTDDYYQVLMEQQSDLTLVLRDIPEGADYDLTIVDSITGETLAEAQHTNNQEEHITLPNQRPGSYSVRVHLHQKPPSASPATYTLTLLAPSATSPTLAGTMQNTRPISTTADSGCIAEIRFTQDMYHVDENAGTAEISVAYDGDTSTPVEVQYQAVAGSAGEDDFVPTEGTLYFDASPSKDVVYATFTVTITNDALEEEYEFVQLSLGYPTPGWPICLGEPDKATLQIHDTTPRPSREDLTIASPYVLSGQRQNPGGNETTVAVGQQVYVVATIDPQDAEGKAIDVCLPDDCTRLQDLQGSGVYAGFIPLSPSSAGNIELVLNVGGDPKRSQMLSVTDNPRTVILTDWNALYNEFLDTGMQPGWEDRNNNGLHDFFELVERIRTYAAKHGGIVIDLPSAITEENSFDANYQTLSYGDNLATRRRQGYLIDQLIETVCTRSQEAGATGCQNVVIIGSDQVVPFYRVFDPLDYYDEGGGYDSEGGHSLERPPDGTPPSHNPLLNDLAQAYIPSDLPYSIKTSQVITPGYWLNPEHVSDDENDGENWPYPDMGIGRIFAPTPHDLTAAIDQYETPLFLSYGKASASLLIGSDEALDHADFSIEEGEFAHKLFVRFFDRLNMPPTDSWNKEDVVQALSNDDLVSVWSHGSYNTIGVADPLPLTADDLGRVRRNNPLAFTAMACHSGISLSTYPDKGESSIINTLANPLVDQGITMFAPSGLAYSAEKKNLRKGSTILHARRFERFTTALLEQETVGQAWVKSLKDYLDSDPATLETQNYAMNLFHLNGAYGMILYGLPTQPIQQSGEREEAATVTCQPGPPPADGTLSPASENSFEITLDIPRLTRQQDEGGGITFGLPHEGQQTGAPGGPVLPLLIRSFLLPEHLALENIELLPPTAEDIRETISDITLTNVSVTAETVTEDGKTTYSTGDDYELPAIYPEIPYGFARPREGNRLVTISAIPLQYEKESRTATLYQRMQFRVSLVRDTPPLDTDVSIPEGQAVYRNRYPQPVTVNVMHEQSDNLTLHWTIQDGEGDVVESGQHSLTNEGQYNKCTLKLNTHDWAPGNKDVHAAIQQGTTMLSSASTQVMVKGISLEEESFEVPKEYTPGWPATLALRLYREDGEPVSGLDSSAFTLSITDSKGNVHAVTPQVSEQQAATVGLSSSGNGSNVGAGESIYTLTFSPPAEVQGENNWLRVRVTLLEEGTEIVGDRTWGFAAPIRPHVYLPLIIR